MRLRHSVRVWFAGFCLACLACGGDDEPEEDVEGLQMCCELGARCHTGPSDPIGGAKQLCHSLGHENDPVQCRAQYESCLEVCVGEGDEPHSCIE